MFFHKLDFIIFFVIVYTIYMLIQDRKYQISFLLLASYIFYGMWDWRFLPLVIVSTVIDYICGQNIYKSDSDQRKKVFLYISISLNLGILFLFKYFDFFVDSFNILLTTMGFNVSLPLLNLVVPLGLSFYTFQTMSYTLDIYRNDYKPVQGFINYAFYVAFFAQLLGGPIERARVFLPQVTGKRKITSHQIEDGLMLFFSGIFKKVVISSRLMPIVNESFNNVHNYSGFTLIIASYFFVFYVYVDFSAYSNMARGIAKLMGFELTPNFINPFVSKSPSEFFSRWHVSLVNWFKEYLFFPLVIKLGSPVWALFVTFVLVGLWHEGTWPWAIWGVYLGAISYIYHLVYKLRLRCDFEVPKYLSGIVYFIQILVMLNFVLLTAFFIVRSNSVSDVLYIMQNIFNFDSKMIQFDYSAFSVIDFNIAAFSIVLLFIFQLFQKRRTIEQFYNSWGLVTKWGYYIVLFSGILLLGKTASKHFIYFSL